MKKIILFLLVLIFYFGISPVGAQELPPQIFDTSNHYLGGCGFTAKTTWELAESLQVEVFQIWYRWEEGEQEVGFVLNKDGEEFLTGKVMRSQCDPYQKSWCNGDLKVEKVFGPGEYELTVENARVCAIPDGNGTVRLYGTKAEAVAVAVEVSPTLKPVAVVTDEGQEEETEPSLVCPAPVKTETTIWTWAAGVSGALNLVFVFLLLRKH